jgi:hypothetical protein
MGHFVLPVRWMMVSFLFPDLFNGKKTTASLFKSIPKSEI